VDPTLPSPLPYYDPLTGKYDPKDKHNFLKNWHAAAGGAPSTWTYNSSLATVPVSYVSLKEARAYCAFKHKRLPHSWEWQYAAQGTDSRPYPWGNASAGTVLHI